MESLDNSVVLKGIRKRLTFLLVGVIVVAVIDGLFFLTHPGEELE